ncbi:MAG: HTH domain-containing protein [Acetatifactor sp.]|nr:HTH domain-containing protein [Acetatifactor sp.]
MSEGRLFQILYYLPDKGETTAAELAQKFEVSIRTIYRELFPHFNAGSAR